MEIRKHVPKGRDLVLGGTLSIGQPVGQFISYYTAVLPTASFKLVRAPTQPWYCSVLAV